MNGLSLPAICRDAMMKVTKQDRHSFVTLSAAKGLVRWAARCFAALSMTVSVLVGKLHNRVRPHASIYESGRDQSRPYKGGIS